VLPIKDGLPKLKDFPAEIGGSAKRCRSNRRDSSYCNPLGNRGEERSLANSLHRFSGSVPLRFSM